MKKVVLLIGLLFIMATVNVKAATLFATICDENGNNCVDVDDEMYEGLHRYDNFKIYERSIILENSNITLRIYKDNLNFNLIGENKITELINTTDNGISVGEGYIPFNVRGEGTLEIEKYAKYNMNDMGEIAYKYWGDIGKGLNLLTRIAKVECSEMMFCDISVPESGWTLSELVDEIDSGAKICLGWFNDDIINSTDIPDDEMPGYTLLKKRIDRALDDGRATDTRNYFEVNIGSVIDAYEPITTLSKVDMDWAEESVETEMPVTLTKSGNLLIGEEPIELVNIVQDESVILEAPEGINSTYTLKVEDIIESATSETIEKVEEKTNKALLKLYEINVMDEENEMVSITEGSYKIRIKLKEDLLNKYENFKVVYIDGDNNVEELATTQKDDYVEFSTTHLSKYGIVGTAKTTEATQATGVINTEQINTPITNPKTLDSLYINVVVFITLTFVVIIASLKLKKIRN